MDMISSRRFRLFKLSLKSDLLIWLRSRSLYNKIENLFPQDYFCKVLFTYPDAEVVKSIARDEFLWVVVLVWRKVFTWQFIVVVREGSQVEWKARETFQTHQRALETSLNETSTYSCDIQVGEFVFNKIDMTASTSRSIFF